MNKQKINTRKLCIQILLDILDAGNNSNSSLAWFLDKYTLSRQERNFITASVYGTLDYLPLLDWQLEKYLTKPLAKLDTTTLLILRHALWQMRFSYAVPVAVAVDEAVKLTYEFKLQGRTALVNAVLRKATTELDIVPCKKKQALQYGMPLELFGLFKSWFGTDRAKTIAESLLRHSQQITLRVKPEFKNNIADLKDLNSARYLPKDAYYLARNSTRLSTMLAEFSTQLYVQDEAPMLVGYLLAQYWQNKLSCTLHKPNLKVLDLCAGVGGKSIDLLWRIPELGLVANEPDNQRLLRLQQNLQRLQLKVEVSNLQAEDYVVPEEQKFDAVIVDAPCSGLGVISNKPEIKLRQNYERIMAMPALQCSILKSALNLVKPGGVVVYATCTLNPAENHAVVQESIQETKTRSIDLTDLLPTTIRDELLQETAQTNLSNGHFLISPDRFELAGFYIEMLQVLK